MLLLIDNYDSFTYNLAHAFEMLGQSVHVVRNDVISAEECLFLNPSFIVIGPGPGNPQGAGISKQCIELYAGRIPLLGVCLGHQAIAEVFGGKVMRAETVMHGKQSKIHHLGEGLFKEVPQGFFATRYHSLIVEKKSLPLTLEMTAWTESGEIMAIRHRDFPLHGVQFHPESIATTEGMLLLENFLRAP